MDFARKQMEKYGWTDGKGLGKHENGISEALKPKLKRSMTGIGHDLAADFTEHWWNTLYDKAASNVQIEEKNGKTNKIKTKDTDFEITNSSWQMKKRGKAKEEYNDYFIKTAVLTKGGSKTKRVRNKSVDEIKVEEDKKIGLKMTDEELFAVCEGRTAHKGARHGLKALGKLARIERQEQMLLMQPQYNGYSHSKAIKKERMSTLDDMQVVEEMNLKSDTVSLSDIKKKKKKRRRCTSCTKDNVTVNVDLLQSCDNNTTDTVSEIDKNASDNISTKKHKNSKRKNMIDVSDHCTVIKHRK